MFIKIWIVVLILPNGLSIDEAGLQQKNVYDFKQFCEKHPFTNKGVYKIGHGDTLTSCWLKFPFKVGRNRKKMRQICGFMALFDQIEEPEATAEEVTCKYVTFATCAPIDGDDQPTLIRDRCVVWKRNRNKEKLPSCPPGYSIPRSVDMKIVYHSPLIMKVPPTAYVNAELSDGKQTVKSSRSSCSPGWERQDNLNEMSTCVKVFFFEKKDDVIKYKNFKDVTEICKGHHGWLAMAKDKNKEHSLGKVGDMAMKGKTGQFFIGGYDTHFDFRESDKNVEWLWLDGTPINNTEVKKFNEEGCLKIVGKSTLAQTSCDGKELTGFICERPDDITRIAPSVVQLYNDDYWGTRFGRIIDAEEVDNPELLCMKTADMDGHARNYQMGTFCEFLEDMGHVAVHKNGICFIMLNTVSTKRDLATMHEVCDDVHGTSSMQPTYLNMNTYTRKVAILEMLKMTTNKFKTETGERTEDVFLMMATETDNIKKNAQCSVMERHWNWLATIQDNYRFNSGSMVFNASWLEKMKYKASQRIFFNLLGEWGERDRLNQIGERITVEMWRRKSSMGGRASYGWPYNLCNDGVSGRTTVVAGREGLQDQPYYFRAPAGCSFGIRKHLIQAKCEKGWTRHIRETGVAVCIKTFNSLKYWILYPELFGRLYKDKDKSRLSRDEAIEECRKESAVLASIKSYEEFKIIASQVHDQGHVNDYGINGFWFWTGARKHQSNDDYNGFHWEEDKEPMGYNYIEHNATLKKFSYKTNGDCLVIQNDYVYNKETHKYKSKSQLMRWHTRECSDSLFIAGYVCTKKAV